MNATARSWRLIAHGHLEAGATRVFGYASGVHFKTPVIGSLAVQAAFLFILTFAGRLAASNPGTETTASLVNEAYGIRQGWIMSIPLIDVPDRSLKFTLPMAGSELTVELHPDSIRTSDFQLLVQRANGTYERLEPQPPRTYSGAIVELAGSRVVASRLTSGLHATLAFPDGRQYIIEPLAERVAGALQGQYVLYQAEDVIPHGGTCQSADDDGDDDEDFGPLPVYVDPPDVLLARIACDADGEYFNRFGDAHLAAEQIEATIHATNAQYERDVGVRHVISAVIIRTGEFAPYDAVDPDDLLRQFAKQWRDHHADIPRSVAQLFTGRDLLGSSVGVAWRYGICNESSYSVVQPGCCTNFHCRTDLSAHELGHNWGAGHCDCHRTTMHAQLTCANRFHLSQTVPDILAYRATRGCLSTGPRVLSLLIEGPPEVVEGSSTVYRAAARFSDDTLRDVTTQASWSVTPDGIARIDGFGRLFVDEVDGDAVIAIRAEFRDETGMVAHGISVEVADLAKPDPRTLEITLRTDADSLNLRPGDDLKVGIYLSSPLGEVDDLRFLQLNADASTGVNVDRIEWSIEGLTGLDAYRWVNGTTARADYLWERPFEGLILHLGDEPMRVAWLHASFVEDGEIRLLDQSTDPEHTTRFSAGFQRVQEFGGVACNLMGGSMLVQRRAQYPAIVAWWPPDGAVDARQPHGINDNTRQGWDFLEFSIDGDPSDVTATDFSVVEVGGTAPPPRPESVERIGESRLRLTLSDHLEVGAWTVVTYEPTGDAIRLAHLPADVDADLSSGPSDLHALLHLISTSLDGRPIWSTDINRSGAAEPSDLLRAIDLLNGAAGYGVWNGRGIQ